MALLKEEERICRGLGDRAGLQTSLGNQAAILSDRGELDRRWRSTRRRSGSAASSATAAGWALARKPGRDPHGPRRARRGDGAPEGVGADLPRAGARAGACARSKPALDPPGPGRARRGDGAHTRAGADLPRARRPRRPVRSLGNQAVIHRARARSTRRWRSPRAGADLPRARRPRRAEGRSEIRPWSTDRGELHQAMALPRSRSGSPASSATPPGSLRSLDNQAGIHQARGELDEAMALHQE